MQGDPRSRNEWCDTASPGAYLLEYADRLRGALQSVDGVALAQASALLEKTAASGGHVYSIGNGGSAAIADHLCCDWTKGTHAEGHPTIATLSLSANVALYSAVANDFGFERVFAAQVEMLGKAGDLLIAISSSGNSANILNAVVSAKARGMSSIGLSGFDGGKLREAVDISLHVAENNYGLVEDAHQAIAHVLAQFIARSRN